MCSAKEDRPKDNHVRYTGHGVLKYIRPPLIVGRAPYERGAAGAMLGAEGGGVGVEEALVHLEGPLQVEGVQVKHVT